MELSVRSRRPQSAPVRLAAIVLLSFVAQLAVVGASYVGGRPAASAAGLSGVAVVSNEPGPDATERNADILATRLGKAETTHGH